MEAFPNIMTIDSYLTEGHLDIERYPQSSTVDFHNKAAGQERRLALYLAENIPFTMEPFEQYIYCTQLLQSECLTSAYKFLKRQWQGPGAEYCSGALVWQLNDCWAGTSWSIVDHYQRPKLGYFAIKRELQPITIGLKRTVHTVPADKYTRAYKKTIHKIEMWACNLSLQSHEVSVRIQTNNVMTRAQTSLDGLGSKVTLLPNRSTEMVEFEVPLSGKYAGKTIEAADGRVVRDEDEQQQQTVVAAYLLNGDGEQIARAINWPEPLKYVHFPKPGHVELKLIRNKGNLRGDNGPFPATALETPPEATAVQVSSDVPVKGLVLETVDPRHQDHEVRFLDNGIDLVPGESVSIGVRGLKCGEEGRLKVRYLGL